jgi:hypothetical protein
MKLSISGKKPESESVNYFADAETEYLNFDYMLNRSNDSDNNRQDFGIYHAYGNVPLVSYPICEMPDCGRASHFVHLARFEVTYELGGGTET